MEQTDTDGQTPDRRFTLSVTEAAGVKSVSLQYYCQPLCQLLIDFQNSFINILLCGRAIVKRLTSFEMHYCNFFGKHLRLKVVVLKTQQTKQPPRAEFLQLTSLMKRDQLSAERM